MVCARGGEGIVMNILVVDDETIQLESLSMGLRRKGHRVLAALTAKEALKYLNNNETQIDLVLTDYAMPGMNGIELLKKTRENHKSLPVIMMTGYAETDLVIDALRNRCDSFIEKPFTLDQLMQEIERAKINIIQNTSTHQLSELIPRLVHQINNPLTSIMGSAQLAMFKLDDEGAVKEYITNIIRSTKKIRLINKKIMELGQPHDVKTEELVLKTLLDECLDMFKDLLNLKGVSVEKHLDNLDIHLVGNRFELEQVFKNLFLNAIDSMDGSPQKLLKIAASMDSKASSVSIHIKDTGCGIPEASIGMIFTQCFTTKRHGTGLGLPVVKGVIERHKGVIRVESQEGKGTTFTVTLPVIDD
jgi:signal transduction histidine kinase